MTELSWPELRASAEAVGVERLLNSLLGCSWGRTVHTPDDLEPCPEQAVRLMVIHAPAGSDPASMEFRFCARHFDRAKAETVTHGGLTDDDL